MQLEFFIPVNVNAIYILYNMKIDTRCYGYKIRKWEKLKNAR